MKEVEGELPVPAISSTLEATWKGMLDVVPAAAYTCDAAGLITYFNGAAEAVWGRTPRLRDERERYCGSYRLYRSDGAPIRHDQSWMALALLDDRVYDGRRIVIERPDGSRVLGEAHAYPLRNRQRQLIGAVNLVADLTAVRDPTTDIGTRPATAVPHDAVMAMIEVIVSVLPVVTLERV